MQGLPGGKDIDDAPPLLSDSCHLLGQLAIVITVPPPCESRECLCAAIDGYALSHSRAQVEMWLAVQSLWMYMEAVFSGGDIVKQLPAEAKRFQNIDKSFMKARARPACLQARAEQAVGADDSFLQGLPLTGDELSVPRHLH